MRRSATASRYSTRSRLVAPAPSKSGWSRLVNSTPSGGWVIDPLRTEMRSEIGSLRSEVGSLRTEFDGKLARLEGRMYAANAALAIAVAGLVIAAAKVL